MSSTLGRVLVIGWLKFHGGHWLSFATTSGEAMKTIHQPTGLRPSGKLADAAGRDRSGPTVDVREVNGQLLEEPIRVLGRAG